MKEVGVPSSQTEPNLYKPEEAVASAAQSQTAAQTEPSAAPVNADSEPAHVSAARPADDSISWTASEFIDHQKTTSWYVLMGAGALVVGVLVWFVTRDFFPATAVALGVGLLGYYGTRKPRQETYVLGPHGISIGNRHYAYADFRSFAVIPDEAFTYIELTPLKRFAMYATMFFDPADEDRILDYLSQYLPMEASHTNMTDGIMRHIHF